MKELIRVIAKALVDHPGRRAHSGQGRRSRHGVYGFPFTPTMSAR